MSELKIIGAGLAGLLAAHAFPKAEILEASAEPREGHKALLRFRGDSVSKLTGVPFRKVLVRKSIFSEGQHCAPNLRIANLYSQKLFGAGVVGPERSVWHTEACERYVAPDDFYSRLIEHLGKRISWSRPALASEVSDGCISTIPMPNLLDLLGLDKPEGLQFVHAPISVKRYKIPNADAFQTVYFPDPDVDVYRASITGQTLIVESVTTKDLARHNASLLRVLDAFGLAQVDPMEHVSQRYGKILPIADSVRKQLMFGLTHKFGIYSLGRFATWRNILLDDVVKDLKVISSIRSTESAYDWRRHAS